MPHVASAEEKAIVRRKNQGSRAFVACLQPHVIYKARLNGVPATTDMVATISYDTGVGTLANVKPDMKMYVGTSDEDWDLGVCRIRKAPIAGTFYIGEQSKIEWEDNCYLTVVDDFDMFAKHIHIDNGIPKMDYDVSFSTQHTTAFKPVPVIGGHTVKQLVGETVDVNFGPEDGYSSWVFNSTIASIKWTIPTAVSIDNDALESIVATFDAVGWHTVYCEVTAANGEKKTGVRYAFIWDWDNLPSEIIDVSLQEPADAGGITFDMEVRYNASLQDIRPGTLAIFFSIDYYDSEEVSLGAILGQENIKGVGRISNIENISYNFNTGSVSFHVEGYQEVFRRITGFPTGLELRNIPTTWTDMPYLTVDRMLWHILEWRTTATSIMDVVLTGDTRYAKELSSPQTNLWNQLEQIAFATIFANVCVDHLGRFFAVMEPLLTPVDDRSYPTIMEITKEDWRGDIEFDYRTESEISQINMSGVNVTAGGSYTALFALSPGHVFDRTGDPEIVDRLLLVDQEQANEQAGLLFSERNNDMPSLTVQLSGNNPLITCFPNQAIQFIIEASDTPRGIAFSRTYIPRYRELTFDSDNMILRTTLTLEAETTPAIAVVGDVPGSGDFTFPPDFPEFPTAPDFPVFLPGGVPSGSDGGPPSVIVHDTTAGILLCNNFDAGENEQEWYAWNAGLTTQQSQIIRFMHVAPSGAIWVAGGSSSIDSFIARAPYANGVFEIIEDQASINAALSASGRQGRVGAISFNPLVAEYVVYILATIDACKIYRGNYGGITAMAGFTTDNCINCDISYGFGKWRLTSGFSPNPRLRIFDAGLTALETLVTPSSFLQFGASRHRPISTSDKLIHYLGTAGTIGISEGNGTLITNNIGSNYNLDITDQESECLFALDPTGQTICTSRSTTGKGKSSDYGSTLSDIANLPVGGYRFAWAGGVGSSSKWIAVSSYLYYTDDFWGSSPIDKRGNILELAPILALDNVKVLSF